MSLIERTFELAGDPLLSKKVLKEKQDRQNRFTRDFIEGNINLQMLRQGLSELRSDEESCIILPSPGPLYGFLRKIGVDQDTAHKQTDEERAHYLVAKKHQLKNTKIIIEFGRGHQVIPDGISLHYYSIFFYYELPQGINEETARTIIREISLAPKEPSHDDLAKLGE